jgi:polyhydroxyalkanoate synthesis regulator phasin
MEFVRLSDECSMVETAGTCLLLSNLVRKLSPSEIMVKQGLKNLQEEKEFLNSLLDHTSESMEANRVTWEHLQGMQLERLTRI